MLREDFSSHAGSAYGNNLIRIETPRLLLREIDQGDTDRFHQISCAEGFTYYCFDGTREKAEAFTMEALRTQAPHPDTGKRENHMLAVELRSTGKVIGHAALEQIHYVDDSEYEINYFIEPAHQKNGYASEAAFYIADYAFHQLGFSAMTATAHPNNAASRSILTKIGYTKIADVTLHADGISDPNKVGEPRDLFFLPCPVFEQKFAAYQTLWAQPKQSNPNLGLVPDFAPAI